MAPYSACPVSNQVIFVSSSRALVVLMKSASNRGSPVKVNVVVLLRIREGNDSFANASVRLEGNGGLGIRAWSFLIFDGTILPVPTFSPLARHPLLPIYHRLHVQDMT